MYVRVKNVTCHWQQSPDKEVCKGFSLFEQMQNSLV